MKRGLLVLGLVAAICLVVSACTVFPQTARAEGSVVTQRFLEDHRSVVFWIHVTANETLVVNGKARVNLTVETVVVRENASLYVSSVQVVLAETNVAASQPILENLTAAGQRVGASLLLSVSDPGFDLIEPGRREEYTLRVAVRGEMRDEAGDLESLDIERSMNVNVLSPEAPATLDVVLPEVVREGEDFQLIARLANNGLFPVTNLRFYVSGYDLHAVQGKYRLLTRVDPGEIGRAEFSVYFEAMGFHALEVDVSYWSFGGYNVSLTQTVLLNVKGLSRVSCGVSRVGVGADFSVQGTVQPSRPNVLVTLESSGDEGLTWKRLGEVETGLNGSYSHVWRAEARGSYLFRASWEGDESFVGAQSDVVRLDVDRDVSEVTLSLSSSVASEDREVVIRGRVLPPEIGRAVTVSYRVDEKPWNAVSVVETRVDGSFEYTWSPPGSGVYYVKASWNGDEDLFGGESSALTLIVEEEVVSFTDEVISFFYSPIGLGLVAVVVAVAAVFLVMRVRRRRPLER